MSESVDLPRIVDSHVHFWDPRRFSYSWMDEAESLRRAYTPVDLEKARAEVEIEAVVFVQAECAHDRAIDELQWVDEWADRDSSIQGLIPFAALEKGAAVATTLEAYAANPKVKGVRRIVQWEADPRFCLAPSFVEGLRALPRFGLHFELCLFARQMAAVVELVQRCPEVSFVLDHLGKPEIAAGNFEPWASQLRELAKMPNVVCKLSGLCTEADPDRWTAADLRPYAMHALDCFGPSRLMFGSDWPVATLGTDYPRWVETAYGFLRELDEAQRTAVMADNARAFYRLDSRSTSA